MYMEWHNLLFLHWPVSPEALRPLVPPPLEIDTHEGEAWVGLVPFTMRRVRHALWPPIPTMTNFHECNVRTYVRCGDLVGVWFFSLDAVSALAVFGARMLWNLNYVHSAIDLERSGPATDYRVERRDGRTMHCRWEVGSPLPVSEPGSLDHFLTERYALFSVAPRSGRVRCGWIWHEPWPLREATVLELRDELVGAAGITVDTRRPPFARHAEFVDVQAWRLQTVPQAQGGPASR